MPELKQLGHARYLFFGDEGAAQAARDSVGRVLRSGDGTRIVLVHGSAGSGRTRFADRVTLLIQREWTSAVVVRVNCAEVSGEGDAVAHIAQELSRAKGWTLQNAIAWLTPFINDLRIYGTKLRDPLLAIARTCDDLLSDPPVSPAVPAVILRLVELAKTSPVLVTLENVGEGEDPQIAVFLQHLVAHASVAHARLAVVVTCDDRLAQLAQEVNATASLPIVIGSLMRHRGTVHAVETRAIQDAVSLGTVLNEALGAPIPLPLSDHLWHLTRGDPDLLAQCVDELFATGAAEWNGSAYVVDEDRLLAAASSGVLLSLSSLCSINPAHRTNDIRIDTRRRLWSLLGLGSLMGQIFPLEPIEEALGEAIESHNDEPLADLIDEILVERLSLLDKVGQAPPFEPCFSYRFRSRYLWTYMRGLARSEIPDESLRAAADALAGCLGDTPNGAAASTLARLYDSAGDEERQGHFQALADWHAATEGIPEITQIVGDAMRGWSHARQQASTELLLARLQVIPQWDIVRSLGLGTAVATLAVNCDHHRAGAFGHLRRAAALCMTHRWDDARLATNNARNAAALTNDLQLQCWCAMVDACAAAGQRDDVAADHAFDDAFSLARQIGSKTDEGLVLCEKGIVRRDRDLLEEAVKLFEQGHDCFRSCNNVAEGGHALHNIGIIRRTQGQLETAFDLFESALECRVAVEDFHGAAATLREQAIVRREQGRFQEALTLLERSLNAARGIQARKEEASGLFELGIVERQLGRLENATATLSDAIKRYREMGDRHGEGVALLEIGHIHREQDDMEGAFRVGKLAEACAIATGELNGQGVALRSMGLARREQGRLDEASEFFGQAVTCWRAVGDRRKLGIGLREVASIRLRQGKFEETRQLLQDAGELLREIGTRVSNGMVLTELAALERAEKQVDRAIAAATKAVDTLRTEFEKVPLAEAYMELSRCERAAGHVRDARKHADEALNLAREAGSLRVTRLISEGRRDDES